MTTEYIYIYNLYIYIFIYIYIYKFLPNFFLLLSGTVAYNIFNIIIMIA